MKSSIIRIPSLLVIAFIGLVLLQPLHAQRFERPGHSIGQVSKQGNIIVLELNEDALGKENLFDLLGKTLRFTPDRGRYRVDNQPLQWDADWGPETKEHDVTLKNFTFPFSGKDWNSFIVGTNGNISFGSPDAEKNDGNPYNRGVAGITVERFVQLAEAASEIINTRPAILAFFKPRMSGSHYVKELADRVVVTWDISEPHGNIQDFTWFKTVNRFQAVLHKDGTIELSYKELAAKDAVVGLFPVISGETEKQLATMTPPKAATGSAASPFRSLKVSVVDGLFLKATFEMDGPVPPNGDPKLAGASYRVHLNSDAPSAKQDDDQEVVWTIHGFGGRDGTQRAPRYIAFGPGALRDVKVSGNTISMIGLLPSSLRGAPALNIRAEVSSREEGSAKPFQLGPQPVRLTGVTSPEVDLSSLSPKSGPFSIVYEAFHYVRLPDPRDMACTVIQGLGDKFDFLAYYSDFRVDNQEAGTPSNGPVGGHVTGIGQEEEGVENYCSKGQFQWEFIQPVYVGSNQMQEYPPPGAPVGTDHDVTYYEQQLSERAGGRMMPYNYAMSQTGHEMGHRWAAFVSAKVGDEKIELGPVHWDMGLQAPVAFPYQRPTEASAMGGGVWQDNYDGTFTRLDDNYYVPATGFSYLDLYLMGLISPAEVPDFFILRDVKPAGLDSVGHQLYKAKRTKVSVQDVIAVEGPRLPDVQHSQKEFNTGIVAVVFHGQKPSPELLQRADGIREQWMKYWSIVTGHRSIVTTNP